MRRRGTAVLAAAVLLAATSGSARAEDRTPTPSARFSLELSGAPYGVVKVSTSGEHLVLIAEDVSPRLLDLVTAFTRGKPLKRDVRLESGAVVKKANDSRLVSVKLPALGSGGVADVELAFLAPSIATQPLLSVKEARPVPAGAKIAGFAIEIGSMAAISAVTLDAVTLTQRPDASATGAGEIAFEASAGGAPPFVAWHKANAARPTSRTMRLAYMGADGREVLRLDLDRCAPTSVRPMGANGTTRITLTCGNVKAG